MASKLKKLFEKAQTWPRQAQEDAAASLAAIEEELSGSVTLSPEDARALERSAADVTAERFADSKDVQSVFRRYRRS